MDAQRLAQTRPGARGAILLEATVPITGDDTFGPWPAGLVAQIHGLDGDEFFVGDGDVDAAREIVAAAPGSELFLYPGDGHLFSDSSLPTYDADATDLMTSRVLEFLAARG
jgi:dienelactone hydrolase